MIELARLVRRCAHDRAGFDPRRDRRRQGACRRGGASTQWPTRCLHPHQLRWVLTGARRRNSSALSRVAYTGADRDRVGALMAANGGTLFLDEPRRAAALGAGSVAADPRVGDDPPARRGRERAVDVRVVAATHRGLGAMMNQGTFRADLFHRGRSFPSRPPCASASAISLRSLVTCCRHSPRSFACMPMRWRRSAPMAGLVMCASCAT